MNIKRYLKKQAKQDRQAILEEDGGKTLRALGVEPPARQRSHRRAWLAGALGAVASAAVLVCVFVFYPFGPKTEEYLDNDMSARESSVEEMNSELHDFSLSFDENLYRLSITRTCDSVSGQALFYKFSVNDYDDILYADFYITCNKNYHNSEFSFSQTPLVAELPQYTLNYQLDSTIDPQYGLETISCRAEIKGEIDCIYITKYSELILDPTHTFLDSVQTFIHAV